MDDAAEFAPETNVDRMLPLVARALCLPPQFYFLLQPILHRITGIKLNFLYSRTAHRVSFKTKRPTSAVFPSIQPSHSFDLPFFPAFYSSGKPFEP
jgi:hypothetical protein